MTTEEILATGSASKREPIEIPEWGGTFYVRQMSVAERGQFVAQAKANQKAGHPELDALTLMIICLRREDGSAVFNESHIQAMSGLSSVLTDNIAKAALKINGLDVPAVENAEKN